MEKQKKSNGEEEAKRSNRQKTFGASSLPFSGDVYSGLVGSIVEKGIVEKPPSKLTSISLPKPTVLPFPVARHRSEGPYWRPVNSKMDDYNNDDSDNNFEDDEDKDFMEFDPVKAHANPVQRRNKKGLDFSKWKEFIQEDNSPLEKKSEESMLHFRQPKEKKMDDEQGKTEDKGTLSSADTGITTFLEAEAKPQSYSSCSGIINSVTPMELDNSNKLGLQETTKDARIYDVEEASKYEAGSNQINSKRMPGDSFGSLDVLSRPEQNSLTSSMDSCSSANKHSNEPVSMSLESQIDAENQARIKQMSAQEIAEAQAEIVEKMSPALLTLLRKRGEEKLRKKSNSILEVSTGRESVIQHAENVNDAKFSLRVKNDVSNILATPPLENKENKLDDQNYMTMTSATGSSSSWNAWSGRVEAVRELRFSLAGDVVENSIDLVSINDNLTERDYLRSEGDPGAAGYTIKEAVALTRSVVPGQRALALCLLSSVLEKVLDNICKHKVGHLVRNENRMNTVDWEAVWAFALGPEPELVLALRMCLDDNHSSVVLACLKVIECVLSCDVNENFFDISEKKATYDRDICSAPVFRTKPDINVGFLPGGFWKYSAKPSNILPFHEDSIEDKTEEKHTIQDDITVAGQDFTAGLVRMGILPKLRYLLETDPTAALEERIMSILVAIARHSPSCANAVLKCQRLIQTIVQRFMVDSIEIRPSLIKSVTLFKVLARLDQKNCLEFIKSGHFKAMTWHLYQHPSSTEHLMKLGNEKCKLGSALIVEQLRFWKVCIQYGYCVSYFSDMFPTLCMWLNPPSFRKLVEKNVLYESASISREAYLVLESLTRRLPKFFSQQCQKLPEFTDAETEVWSWSFVGPMVDLAMKWIETRSDPEVSKLFEGPKKVRADFASQDLSVTSLLWVYAAVVHMLFRVLERLTPEDAINSNESGGPVPWLPEFVPKIGLQLIKFWLLGFSVSSGTNGGRDPDGCESFIEELIFLRENGDHEMSMASVNCLNGMVKVIGTLDHLVKSAKNGICGLPPQNQTFSKEGKMLEDGILNASCVNLKLMLDVFTNLVASGWQCMLSIETFGRGGPAPGVGIGWGAPGGGFWSQSILLAQTDAIFLVHLLDTLKNLFVNTSIAEETAFITQRINSALAFCLIAGPGDGIFLEKAVDQLFDVSVLKYLDLCIQKFLLERRGETFRWQYEEEDYQQFSRLLSSHFRRRWLSVKLKSNAADDNNVSGAKTYQKGNAHLDTIYEDVDMSTVTRPSYSSLTVEWARQRLPLPVHFHLSPISTIVHSKQSGPKKFSSSNIHDQTNLLEVARSGLFFVLGVEAMSNFQYTDFPSPIQHVSLTWKIHTLSVNFLAGMEVLEQEQGKETFEALQDLYGELLDKERSTRRNEVIQNNNSHPEFLRFQSEIFESYSTVIEDLVEQFSAISYGDLIFGRQVALYLHRCVESSIRLAAWNALSNARVLELLPPLEKCISGTEGYLDPVEDNEGILDAYVKSWVSGSLDRAAIRGSVAYSLVVHHLSSFLFHACPADKMFLRNRLFRSLLRDYAEKQQHEGMMLSLICHNKPLTSEMDERKGDMLQEKSWLEPRLEVLSEACEGYSSLLTQVNKLKAIILGNS